MRNLLPIACTLLLAGCASTSPMSENSPCQDERYIELQEKTFLYTVAPEEPRQGLHVTAEEKARPNVRRHVREAF